MKGFVKMIVAGVTIFIIGLIIMLVFMSLNGWTVNGNFEMKEYTCESDVTTLQLDLSAGTFETVYTDDEKIIVEYPENHAFTTECTYDNGTLKITNQHKHWYNMVWFGTIPKATIKIPKGTVLNLDLEISAGKVNLDEAIYGNVNIELSAGSLNMSKSSCERFDCDISAGSVTVDNLSCDNIDLDVSAGGFEACNVVCPQINVHISAGSAQFSISGAKSDYNFYIEKSAGSCNVESDRGNTDKTIRGNISAGSLNFDFSN